MARRVKCPKCEQPCSVVDAATEQNCQCKTCYHTFRVKPLPTEADRKHGTQQQPSAPRAKTSPRPEEDEDTRPARRDRKSAPTKANSVPMIVALGLGACVGMLIVGLGLAWVLSRPTSSDDKQASVKELPGKLEPKIEEKEPVNKEPVNKELVNKEPEKKDPVKIDPVVKPPVKEPEEVKPVVITIKPPTLTADKVERTLPGNVTDVAVGGAGRYLVLHLPSQRKLAIFDVNEAKVTNYISVADDQIKFTAGLEKLIVVLCTSNVLQRYDLATATREVAAPLPVTGSVKNVCMGSASHGPVLMHWGTDALDRALMNFVDLKTLKVLETKVDYSRGSSFRDQVNIRASADGRVFGLWKSGSSPSGITAIVSQGATTKTYDEHDTAGMIVPSADGKYLLTGTGLFTNEVKKVPGARPTGLLIPATQGAFYLSLRGSRRFAPPGEKDGPAVMLHMLGSDRPLMAVSGVASPFSDEFPRYTDLAGDKRVHFVPAAKVILTIPSTNDKVIVHKFDIDQALEKSGIDYLIVMSQPPSKAKRGATLNYRLDVKSKQGAVKCKLDSGPPGMRITEAGTLTWAVPATAPAEEVAVIISVTDRSGQEIYHTFKLYVGDESVAMPSPMPRPMDPIKPVMPTKPRIEMPRPVVVLDKLPPSTATDLMSLMPGRMGDLAPLVFLGQQLSSLDYTAMARVTTPTKGPVVITIRPPTLEKDKVERKLPSSIRNIAVGGGGRYLVLHLPEDRKLAVFDVNEAKVIYYIPLTSDQVKFTAGREKVMVALVDSNIIQRYDITTGKREMANVLAGVKKTIQSVNMGSNSVGPMMVTFGDDWRNNSVLFVNPITLAPSLLKSAGTGRDRFDPEGEFIRVSGDGKVFTCWHAGSSPQGLYSLVIQGNTIATYYHHKTFGHVTPSFDGRSIYTARGRFTNQLKAIGDAAEGIISYGIPAQGPGFYLTVPVSDRFTPTKTKGKGMGVPAGSVAVHVVGDTRALVTVPDVDLPSNINAWDREVFGTDKRILFIPDAKVIITIPSTNDKLVLHRFDIDKALEKAGVDFLFITTQAPPTVKRGTTFRYQMNVRSKRGGVEYKLESGPKGMSVSRTGLVSWVVPASASLIEDREVIITVRDASAQEQFHTFKLRVVP